MVAVVQQQVQQSLALVFSNWRWENKGQQPVWKNGMRPLTIVTVALHKHEQALVVDHRQRSRGSVSLTDISGSRRIPEEVEDESVHALPRYTGDS